MQGDLEYTLTEADWQAYYDYAKRGQARLLESYQHLTLFALLAAAAVDLVGTLFYYRVFFPFVLAFCALWILISGYISKAANATYVKSTIAAHVANPGYTRHVLSIDGQTLRQRSGVGESCIHLDAIDRLGETTHHYFVLFAGTVFCIIPKRAFPDAAATKAFVSRLDEKSAAASR